MNVPDSSAFPEPRPLSERVDAQLRDAIVGVQRNTGTEDALREALREAAAEARQRGLRPEELIIALKALIDDLPGMRSPATEDRVRLRDRIVSACIRAYFGRE